MSELIPFNVPHVLADSERYVQKALEGSRFSGAGPFAERCAALIKDYIGSARVLLTPSCTDALEMMGLILEIGPGDEVIMPSYTFVSTANAFVLRGATPVFVDVHPETMNLDERLVEGAITNRTRAVIPVHYAGVGCAMGSLQQVCKKHGLHLLEDAAQALMATRDGFPLGSQGQLAAFSFHETKNYHCGEGGALAINDPALVERAEIIYEKGTNRSRFFRGQVDKYTWVEGGSSFLMPELSAAFLLGQLEHAREVTERRRMLWDGYYEGLGYLEQRGDLARPSIPDGVFHNAHMFQIKVADLRTRTELLKFLNELGVMGVFHYVPLHSSPAGRRLGRFVGEDRYTTVESERLVRLPLYYGLSMDSVTRICHTIERFFAHP